MLIVNSHSDKETPGFVGVFGVVLGGFGEWGGEKVEGTWCPSLKCIAILSVHLSRRTLTSFFFFSFFGSLPGVSLCSTAPESSMDSKSMARPICSHLF